MSDNISKNDFRRVCKKIVDKFGLNFIERIERRIGEDFEKALDERPKDLLITILEDIHLRFIIPFEMVLQTSDYLSEIYGIKDFSLALSEGYHLSLSKRQQEIERFVDSFYRMVEDLGLLEQFGKQKKRWWKNEFQF